MLLFVQPLICFWPPNNVTNRCKKEEIPDVELWSKFEIKVLACTGKIRDIDFPIKPIFYPSQQVWLVALAKPVSVQSQKFDYIDMAWCYSQCHRYLQNMASKMSSYHSHFKVSLLARNKLKKSLQSYLTHISLKLFILPISALFSHSRLFILLVPHLLLPLSSCHSVLIWAYLRFSFDGYRVLTVHGLVVCRFNIANYGSVF